VDLQNLGIQKIKYTRAIRNKNHHTTADQTRLTEIITQTMEKAIVIHRAADQAVQGKAVDQSVHLEVQEMVHIMVKMAEMKEAETKGHTEKNHPRNIHQTLVTIRTQEGREETTPMQGSQMAGEEAETTREKDTQGRKSTNKTADMMCTQLHRIIRLIVPTITIG
jgi:hypothetical protein